MRAVVESGRAGTAHTTPAVEVAGQTGTAEVASDSEEWHSWFAAYGPYCSDDPEDQIVVVVMVDAANEWESWATRAANTVFAESSQRKTVAWPPTRARRRTGRSRHYVDHSRSFTRCGTRLPCRPVGGCQLSRSSSRRSRR